MMKLRMALLAIGLFAIGGGIVGQEVKTTPKPAADKDAKEAVPAPAKTKSKSQLPTGWRDLGLTEEQKAKVYAIDAKYDEDIDAMTAKIKVAKDKKKKEQLEVLTMEQKKRLEDALKKKAGTDK